jgi:hypothetical protein
MLNPGHHPGYDPNSEEDCGLRGEYGKWAGMLRGSMAGHQVTGAKGSGDSEAHKSEEEDGNQQAPACPQPVWTDEDGRAVARLVGERNNIGQVGLVLGTQ